MLVRNYGFYWSPERVFWGSPGVEESLLGTPMKSRRLKPTDFREQIAVYVLFQDFTPVYAGQTGLGKQRLFRRLRWHRKDHLAGRWDSFSWFGVLPVNPKSRRLRVHTRPKPDLPDVLNHMEALLIAAVEPALNLQRGRFGNAVQYLLHEDPRLPVPLSEQISELRQQVNQMTETPRAGE